MCNYIFIIVQMYRYSNYRLLIYNYLYVIYLYNIILMYNIRIIYPK